MSLIFIYYLSILNIKLLFHMNQYTYTVYVCKGLQGSTDYLRAKIYFQFRSLDVCVFLSQSLSVFQGGSWQLPGGLTLL